MNVDKPWISLERQQPAHGQAVIYFSPQVGVWRGKFDATAYCFYGDGGFIDGYDVTAWMEDEGQFLPQPPATVAKAFL
jgi:hypothetical protein